MALLGGGGGRNERKGTLALEIFGPLLIAGINTHPPPPPPPSYPHTPFLAISTFDKDWNLYGTERAFIRPRPLAARLETSEGKRKRAGEGERKDPPAVTNDYEHLLIPLAFIIWRKGEKPEAGGGACLHPAEASREEPTESRAGQRGADWRKHAIVASPMI